jgi:TolB-like protein/Tfp pilus assembly protein PilF
VDFETGINAAVKRLRQALGDSADAPQFIETLPRRGYRFIYPIESMAAEVSQQGRASRPALLWAGLAAVALVISMPVAPYVAGRDRIPGTRVLLPVRSITVLPFSNLTGQAEQEYLVDGIVEDLTMELAIKQWRVLSVTSAMTYKHETKKRLPQIARELDVEVCVGGSVQRSGDLLLVNVRLIHRTDQVFWSHTYKRDGKAPHIWMLPREIARDLVHAMQVQLSTDEQARLTSARTLNPQAYDIYLQGLHQLSIGPPETRRDRAEQLFVEATRVDPGFAPAYSQLALLYAHGGVYLIGGVPSQREKTREWARKALDLDGGLAEAHAALGWVDMTDWEWSRAEERFLFAIEKNPNLRVAHTWYGQYLNAMGRNDEALVQADYAIHLNPAIPESVSHAATVYMHGGQLDKAIGIYQQMIRQADQADQADYWFAHHALGEAYILKGRYREAIPELEKAMALRKRETPPTKGLLAQAYVGAGEPQKARQIVAELERLATTKPNISPYGPVMAYLALGEHERALDWLETAHKRHGEMMWMLNREVFDPIRLNPRFQALVQDIELPRPSAGGTTRGVAPAK